MSRKQKRSSATAATTATKETAAELRHSEEERIKSKKIIHYSLESLEIAHQSIFSQEPRLTIVGNA
jgi:hypothetical protein